MDMRRLIGADRVAHVAERAGIGHRREITALHIIERVNSGAVYQVEQPWETVAEIAAAAAVMTHAEDAPQFPVKRVGIEKIGGLPVDCGSAGTVRRAVRHAGVSSFMISLLVATLATLKVICRRLRPASNRMARGHYTKVRNGGCPRVPPAGQQVR